MGFGVSRTVNQNLRISQGVKSGQITKQETKAVVKMSQEVSKNISNGALDGWQPADVVRADKGLDKVSRSIFELKHN